jgi:hypothetical protein
MCCTREPIARVRVSKKNRTLNLLGIRPGNARSSQGLFGLATLPLPFVVLTQARLMFFDLGLKLGERLARAGGRIGTVARGMQRAGRQRKVRGKNVLGLVRLFFKTAMELHEVRLVSLEKLCDLVQMALKRCFNRLWGFDVTIADIDFHMAPECREWDGRGMRSADRI